jgi:hypothetical protein
VLPSSFPLSKSGSANSLFMHVLGIKYGLHNPRKLGEAQAYYAILSLYCVQRVDPSVFHVFRGLSHEYLHQWKKSSNVFPSGIPISGKAKITALGASVLVKCQ